MKYNELLVKNERFIVCMSYGDYMIMHGGVNRYLLEYSKELLNDNISIVFIYPKTIKNPTNQSLIAEKYGCKIDGLEMGISVDIESLIYIVNYNLKHKRRLVDIHIHHLRDLQMSDVSRVVDLFDTTVKFFLHDYYCICTNQLLLDVDKEFCRVEESNCVRCVHYKKRISHFEVYRKFFSDFSDRITIISPSECAKNNWEMAFGKVNEVLVLEHQAPEEYKKEISSKNHGEQINVAYVGNSRFFKGYDYWIEAIKNHNDNISFIEYSDAPKSPDAILRKGFFSKDNIMFMRDKLIEDDIDVVVLWSICQETYSYTLFEALEAGAVVLTNDEAGNIPCMVEKYKCGAVLKKGELAKVLSDYDYLVNLYNENQTNKGYRFSFNHKLISLIPDTGFSEALDGLDVKIKDHKLFSFVYDVYNWLRVKVIKV